jgi:hypothetical protein
LLATKKFKKETKDGRNFFKSIAASLFFCIDAKEPKSKGCEKIWLKINLGN